MQLIELPDIVLEIVLSNLSFDEISRNRIICKRFDRLGRTLLNRGFNAVEKYHSQCTRNVKSQLPRRESERRCHPLSRHNDILAAIETRISMLSMTFTKYIDLNLCCFIPGKVIDEIFRLLRVISAMKTPPRAHEILQELRDLSSMAMEHFDEKIMPDLKQSICTSMVSKFDISSTNFTISHSSSSNIANALPHCFTTDKLNQIFKKIYSRTRKNKLSSVMLKSQMNKMKQRMKKQSIQIRVQNKKALEQERKVQSQELQIADMKKHLEEWEQKVGDLTAKVSRAHEETDNIDHKRKHMDHVDLSKLQNLQAKKRKLIIERQASNDAKDVKFKNFMSTLLGANSGEETTGC